MTVLDTATLTRRVRTLNSTAAFGLEDEYIDGQVCGCSGFVTDPQSTVAVYINTSNGGNPEHREALYRTATDVNDYLGGPLGFAHHDDLARVIAQLLRTGRH